MKFIKIAVLFCVLGFIAAAAFATGSARASVLGDLFAKKQSGIPYSQVYPIQNEDDFQANAKARHGLPYDDPQLEYEIMIPKDWVSEETPQMTDANGPSRQLMGDIARYRSPVISTMQAILTIQSVKLDHEISAESWLKNYILSNKYNLQEAVVPVNDRKAGANFIATGLDGSSSYIYITVQFNGNNAVIVRLESPLALKGVLDFARNRIVDSFRFILETDHPIEGLKSFSFSNALRFRYPQSLTLNHVDVGDTRHMSMQLYNIAMQGMVNSRRQSVAQIQGYFRFIVVKRTPETNLKKETDDIKSFIDKYLSLEFKKLVESKKAPVSKRFIFSRYEVYQVSQKKGNTVPQELKFVALGDKNWYVFGVLLSPSENENPDAWAIDNQDFNMMLRDFR
jgi:hypothetical protein